MPPERKEICDCGALENASKEADHPIRWDDRMNEYYLAYGKDGRMMIYYALSAVAGHRNRGVLHSLRMSHRRRKPAFTGYSEEFGP